MNPISAHSHTTIQSSNSQIALPVMEHFYTIQGEGMHAGRAAYFVRLGGCDVECVWCDVKESWPKDAHPAMTLDEIVYAASQHPGRLAVITGGEPLMHNLDALTDILQKAGFETNIETSGAHPLSGSWNWICLSPKKFKNPLPEIYQKANELKVIVYNKMDFKWAEEQAAKVTDTCALLLQPEWSKRDKMMPLIVEYVKANPRWRSSLQTHKYMQIP